MTNKNNKEDNKNDDADDDDDDDVQHIQNSNILFLESLNFRVHVYLPNKH